MEVELLKNLSGGGAVLALIAVIILFLKDREAYNNKTENLINSFQTQITTLTNQVIEVSRDTTKALTALEDAVRNLQNRDKS